MYELLSRTLGRFPPISIIGRWLIILKRIRGVNLKEETKLLISFIWDSVRTILAPFKRRNPEALFKMNLRTNNGIEFTTRARSDDIYFMVPRRERDVHDFIENVLKSADVFVDVGANVGYYTILACKYGVRNIFSIEAHPETFGVLKRNVEMNSCNANLLNRAIWNEDGKYVDIVNEGGQKGMAFVKEGGSSIKTITLDTLLKGLDSIDLIKIDVEGAEYRVLIGAKDVLKRTNYLVLEITKDEDKIVRLLEEYGFRVQFSKFSRYIISEKH